MKDPHPLESIGCTDLWDSILAHAPKDRDFRPTLLREALLKEPLPARLQVALSPEAFNNYFFFSCWGGELLMADYGRAHRPSESGRRRFEQVYRGLDPKAREYVARLSRSLFENV